MRYQRGFVSGNVGAGIFFILLVVFIVWFLSAPSGKERLERACRPAYWFMNIFVSIAEIGGDMQAIVNLQRARDDFDYGCRHVLWRQFYYEDWLRMQQEKARQDKKEKP